MSQIERLNQCRAIHSQLMEGYVDLSRYNEFSAVDYYRLPPDFVNLSAEKEAFAVTCRTLLEEHFPDDETQLVLCRTPEVKKHLVVAMGNIMFDPLQATIKCKKTLERLEYKFMYISRTGGSKTWRKLFR